MYLVNGVVVGGVDESWSMDDWVKVFDFIFKVIGFGMIYFLI